MEIMPEMSMKGVYYSQIALTAFFAILFVQSGLDKLINFRENLSFLVSHFSKTFFSGMVPVLLIVITSTEVGAGLTSAYGLLELLLHGNHKVAFYGAVLASTSLVFLFLGQRIARDYSGAAGLVHYFVASILAMLLCS